MKPIETKDCITAVQHFADEHGKEEAYQSATWLFKAQIITQEQWSAMVHPGAARAGSRSALSVLLVR